MPPADLWNYGFPAGLFIASFWFFVKYFWPQVVKWRDADREDRRKDHLEDRKLMAEFQNVLAANVNQYKEVANVLGVLVQTAEEIRTEVKRK